MGASMTRPTRPVSWIRPALKDFEAFPEGARLVCMNALTIAAEGGKADIAKPLHGLGNGTFEIALTYQGEAYRVVYNVAVAADVWVLHAFRKKSTRGVKTPQRDIDVIKKRLRAIKEISG
jgi:phage-related protein